MAAPPMGGWTRYAIEHGVELMHTIRQFDPYDTKGWGPFLLQALAVADGEVVCESISPMVSEVCRQAFVDALEELLRGPFLRPEPKSNRGSG